jgi:hypothetical protein
VSSGSGACIVFGSAGVSYLVTSGCSRRALDHHLIGSGLASSRVVQAVAFHGVIYAMRQH